MKQGEEEAKIILEKYALEFDESYHDDNSKKNMPDFLLTNGRYIEVTHTIHNNAIFTSINNFSRKSIEEKIEIMNQVKKASERINNRDYKKDSEGNLLPKSLEQYKKDIKLVDKYYGSNHLNFSRKFSEFNCDRPIIDCSANNIIEIMNIKAKKHRSGIVDLFIFVMEDELNSLNYYFSTRNYNGFAQQCLHSIMKSPFENIYLCTWEIEKQRYNTTNPLLLHIKNDSKCLSWSFHQL